jgi:hypothetical protein
MLWNIPKNQFWSNGVEWMFHNFGTLKQCIPARNTSFASFYLLKVSEMLRNTPKHHFRSNGVEWILHNFGTPKQCIQSQNTSVASFYPSKVSEIRWNTPKHHFGSNGDVSQLWYPETVYSDPKHKFCICIPVEGLRNAPKHSQTSFSIQWRCFTTLVPRNSAFRLGTQVLHLFTCRRLAKCSQTLPKINLGPME